MSQETASLQRATIIVNPRSGRNRGLETAERVRATLIEDGIEAQIEATTGPGDATRIGGAFEASSDALFVLGGDGTVREVLAGLAAGSKTALAIIPQGTANVLAREFGIPLDDPERATRMLARGETRQVDVGLVNGVPFLANVGIGFDANVVHELDAHRRRLRDGRSISMLSYLPIGLGLLSRFRPPALEISVDGERIEGVFREAIICNAANYGGIMSVTPEAHCGDGLLDLALRRRGGRLAVFPHLVSALLRWKDPRGVLRRRARKLEIRAASPAAVQADGDPRGETPISIELRPEPATFLVPEGALA